MPAERASAPPGSTPGFLMPKPGAAVEPADPWRERLAAAEVQAQATRAFAQRTSEEATAARQRAEAAEVKVRALETELATRMAALQAMIESARAGATDRPPPLDAPEGLAERLERVDRLTAQARVALDTIQQELAEHARLFSARKARLDSLETRVAKVETDPRLTDVTRQVEAFDLKLSTLLPQLEGVASITPRVLALEASGERLESMVEAAVERALAKRPAPKPASKSADEDELRTLKGVGPKLAKQLRDLGVTRVAEIAAWGDDDVAGFAEKLGTTVAKIKKAGWVEAARATLG